MKCPAARSHRDNHDGRTLREFYRARLPLPFRPRPRLALIQNTMPTQWMKGHCCPTIAHRQSDRHHPPQLERTQEFDPAIWRLAHHSIELQAARALPANILASNTLAESAPQEINRWSFANMACPQFPQDAAAPLGLQPEPNH